MGVCRLRLTADPLCLRVTTDCLERMGWFDCVDRLPQRCVAVAQLGYSALARVCDGAYQTGASSLQSVYAMPAVQHEMPYIGIHSCC